MSRTIPRIIALAPGGPEGLAVAVAAGRAGALGLLDLAGADRAEGLDAARRAARLAGVGVRVEAGTVTPDWLDALPAGVAAVCCLVEDESEAGALGRVRGSGRLALAEVTSREGAKVAAEAGADARVVAGHEAGGRCSAESSFILLQAVAADGGPPVWVRGGIGPASAGGCIAAGAAGVVLDGALLLARESPISDPIRDTIARLDGSESVIVSDPEGGQLRLYAPIGSESLAEVRNARSLSEWKRLVAGTVGWQEGDAWPLGQDAAFAAGLARRHVTVGGIVAAIGASIDRGLERARSVRPLAPGSALAASHGTAYPIVQGPMTRVSDSVAFALAVAEGGALPFLALAMLRGAEARALLADAAARLAGRPWGVGLLGFVDPDLRRAQVEAIRAARPPFALIAGGRPDQARDIEADGIAAYLHVPSPGLLAQYLRDGARRFVLEGRECGGHVGPRSSLVLWEQAIAGIEAFIGGGGDPTSLHVLFAGGVHDARSSAAVATMAAPLAAAGVKVGVLVGTAYLFTREAVATGAIVPRFQAEAIACGRTVLLETGPGHEVRVGPSPFVEAFAEARRRLVAEGRPAEEVRNALERLNAGRLRVAAKGLDRAEVGASALVEVAETDQFERGIYMLGQVATLRDAVTTVADLHREIAEGATAILASSAEPTGATGPAARPSDVAIVGMSAIFPGAGDARTFWENTLKGVDAIVEIPPDRWDWRPYYDADPKAPDRIVSRWGGFVPDVPFDPLRYGMPPKGLASIEPVQLLVLEAVRAAIEDAGYAERAFPRERTAVVLGMGGGAAQLAMGYAFRSYLPMLEAVAPEAGRAAREASEPLLPEWTEDSFPGFLLNVAAGRVANRFDLGGANYTVDAACGSSLAAASLAVRELETGAADVVILGGADTVQNPLTYLAFSKTHAFSPRGRCRPFDASADGIVISEGVGVVVLKRLADAERDGDRVYAVIKGIGSSSDGRARGLTAPSPEGQVRALDRAYEKAGVDPRTIGYVEAHGTGTAVGDVVEANALAGVLRGRGAAPGSCAVGSVKSMIGHTKCAAGIAGLMNAALALHHRTLPPTIGVDHPNPKADLADGPLRVSTAARPWFHAEAGRPRRAGVSAFGFGGTNFHAVLEGYDRDPSPAPPPAREWPAELLLWRAGTPGEVAASIDRMVRSIDEGARPRLRDLARSLADRFDPTAVGRPTLAIVATSVDDLRGKLAAAHAAIEAGRAELADPRGVYYAGSPAFAGAGVAFVFPGQGSQSLEMMGDLAIAFPEVREGFEAIDAALLANGRAAVTPLVFPATTLDHAGRDRARQALMATDVAQPAVGAASVGLIALLARLGIRPDVVAGHSYGELVALHAARALDVAGLAVLSEARGRLMIDAAGAEPGAMAAIAGGAGRVAGLIAGIDGVVVANLNGPGQTVVSGPRDGIVKAVEAARGAGLRAFELPVSCAFHSPIVAGASEPLARLAARLLAGPPDRPVFANLDAAPHPADPSAIAGRLGEHLASPVRFAEVVAAMHDRGSRAFVEVGPGAILAPMVGSILGDRPHLAVSCDAPGRPGVPALLHALARLAAAGVAVRPGRLTQGRDARRVDLDRLPVGDGSPAPSPSTWLVNGSRARPIDGPEPRRLGQAIPAPEADRGGSHAPPARNGHHTDVNTNGKHHASITLPVSPLDTDDRPMHRNGKSNGHPGPSPRSMPMPTAQHSGNPPTPVDPFAARVMEAFQQTMRNFLEVQQATMLAYLGRRGAGASNDGDPGVGTSSREGFSVRPIESVGPRDWGRHGIGSPAPRPDSEERPEGPGSPERLEAPASGAPSRAAGMTARVRHEAPAKVPHSDRAGRSTSTAATVAEVPVAPVVPEATGREAIAGRLAAIVRDRTGYPAEMLKLDLDLEADLGIDSIKRVEILGTLRDSVDGLDRATDSALMDGLARARTLGEIVDRVDAAVASLRPASPMTAGRPVPTADPKPEVRRMTLEAVAAPLPDRGAGGLAPGGVIVITDDGRGVAGALAATLREAGHGVALVDPGRVDLASTSAVEAMLAGARASGPIVGIVHALPLRAGAAAGPGLDFSAWSGRVGPEVKGLFLLARGAAGDLDAASRRGGGCLVAATSMGGAFASAGTAPDDFFPGHGAVAGLVKTLAREWPDVRTRVVDFDAQEHVSAIAARLAAEATADDGWPEVGYHGGRRVRLRAVEVALGPDPARFAPEPGEPVLVTGGARGITAAVAVELARRWRPTLLLVGSSPIPAGPEDPATAGLASPAELKAALHGRLRRAGREVGPADLERAYRSTRNDRQIRDTLRRIGEAGSVVEYAQADVRDAEALGRAVDRWRGRFGDPVGLIHGAGVIHDKLLRDKTPESFDRVLGTKLDGALNLARLLRPEAMKFAALFSSVAGRFGNQGQSDYAAANEALNKLAIWLDRRWPGRVVSLGWGPWSGVGMVSDLEGHLGRRGLGMIPPDVGCAAMADEIRSGRKGDVEIVVAGGLGSLDEPLRPAGHRAEPAR